MSGLCVNDKIIVAVSDTRVTMTRGSGGWSACGTRGERNRDTHMCVAVCGCSVDGDHVIGVVVCV